MSSHESTLDQLNLSDDLMKTFGLLWQPTGDFPTFAINLNNPYLAFTKRSILSTIAQIFDPLGLLSPLTITAKIILQKLWQLKTSWDEFVPASIHTQWSLFRTTLDQLANLKILRHFICHKPRSIELHGFADSSQNAYGACIYKRSLDENNKWHCHLVCSKTRVAPLKVITIPQLELCAAVLLA